MDKLKNRLENGETVTLINESTFAKLTFKYEKLSDGHYYKFGMGENGENVIYQSKVWSNSFTNRINAICIDFDVDTAIVDCDKCEGNGEFDVMNCKNNSNECCGGCYIKKDCDKCDMSGQIEINVLDLINVEYPYPF